MRTLEEREAPSGSRQEDRGPTDGLLLAATVMAPDEVLREMGSSREGLTQQDAEARLARHGRNELPKQRGPGLLRHFLDQLVHFFALILWVAAGLAFVGGMPQLGWAIIVVIVVNAAFSFAQEFRAERAVRALSLLLPATAVARRGGRKDVVQAAELVPGDVVLLREGDRVCADARVLQSAEMRVDMSMLTGESKPSHRTAEPVMTAPADSLEAENVIFAGTFITSGSGSAVIMATGGATRLGGISTLTAQVIRRPTPLRLQLNRAVRVIAGSAVATGLAFFGISIGVGMTGRDGFLFAVGVIVALVPEGLLPTLSLSLAMSATRMARHGALVRRLESVETLGSTTVICSDKTGTMTANEMTARVVVTRGHEYRASGSGYDPTGTILTDGRPLSVEELEAVALVLRTAILCTDARVDRQDGRWRCTGDPTEGALVVLARKGGVERTLAERMAPRVREFPFESARRRMSTVHALPAGTFEINSKGSPEVILERCTFLREGGATVPLTPEIEARVLADVEHLAGEGYRVLAFARREMVGDVPTTAGAAECDLELLGLVGMEDPIRAEVRDSVEDCRRAGIRVVMITGDHPSTARSVAAKVGLGRGRVLTGNDLPREDRELSELLADPAVSVLARVAPEQKLRIAQALQARGEIVAMTGDGVNDAPALRRADIGVAMGVVGTDVAREAADLVLLDDNFAHIVEAVKEGRAAYDNIKRFLTYHLTDNVAELTPFVVWALSGGTIPLMISVLQVLALDIGTDLLPALALGAERPEHGIMDRPPRPRRAGLLDRRVMARAFGFLGPVEAIVSMALLPIGAALFFGWPANPLPMDGPAKATLSTMVFAAIVMMQVANAFECRSTSSSLLSIGPFSNRLLIGAVVAEGLALVAFVHLPFVRDALGQHALSGAQWLLVLAAPWVLLAAEELRKALIRRRSRESEPRKQRAARTFPELIVPQD